MSERKESQGQPYRIKIGEPRIGHGAIVLGADGVPLENVVAIEIDPILPDALVTATIKVFVSDLEVDATGRTVAICPACQKGLIREVETSDHQSPGRVMEYQQTGDAMMTEGDLAEVQAYVASELAECDEWSCHPEMKRALLAVIDQAEMSFYRAQAERVKSDHGTDAR
jgi:hypothetical protein